MKNEMKASVLAVLLLSCLVLGCSSSNGKPYSEILKTVPQLSLGMTKADVEAKMGKPNLNEVDSAKGMVTYTYLNSGDMSQRVALFFKGDELISGYVSEGIAIRPLFKN